MIMKRHIPASAIVLASLLFLTNCTEELHKEQEERFFPYTIFANPAATKTVNDDILTYWSDGDELTVFHSPAGSTSYSPNTVFALTDKEQGRFETDRMNGILSPSNDWYVLYPYNSTIKSPAGNEGYVNIGQRSIRQEGYNNLSHLSGSNDPLYGVAKNVSSQGLPGLTMHHLSSVVRIQVTNDTEEPVTITSATLTAETDIAGAYHIDMTGEEIKYTKVVNSEVSNTAGVIVDDGWELNFGNMAELYIPVKPFTATAGSKMVLGVNGKEKEIELKKDFEFEAGKIKTLRFSYDMIDEEEPGTKDFDFVWEVPGPMECEGCLKHRYELGSDHVPVSHNFTISAGVTENGNACPWRIEYADESDRQWIRIQETGIGVSDITVELNGNPSADTRTAHFRLIALDEKGDERESSNLLRIGQNGVKIKLLECDNSDSFEATKDLVLTSDYIFHPPYPSTGSFQVECNADSIRMTPEIYTGEGYIPEGAVPEITAEYDNRTTWNCTLRYDSNRHINYNDPFLEPWRGATITIDPVIYVHDWTDDGVNKGTQHIVCDGITADGTINSFETIQFGAHIFAADYIYISGPIADENSRFQYYNKAYAYDEQLNYSREKLIIYTNVNCRISKPAKEYLEWDYDILAPGGELIADGHYYTSGAGDLYFKDMLDNWQAEPKYNDRPIIRNTEVRDGRIEWLYAEADLNDGQGPLLIPFTIIAQYGIPSFRIKEVITGRTDTNVGHFDFFQYYTMPLEIVNPDDTFSEYFIKDNTLEYTSFTDPYEHPGYDPYEWWLPADGSGTINTSLEGYWGSNYFYHDLRMKYPEGGYVYASEPISGYIDVQQGYSTMSSDPAETKSDTRIKCRTSNIDIKERGMKYSSSKKPSERLTKR